MFRFSKKENNDGDYKKKSTFVEDTLTILMPFLFLLGLTVGYLVTDRGIVTHAVVCGQSMYPTYEDGQELYYANAVKPCHDDIAVFNMDGTLVIKRVIGVGGDTIQIQNSHIIRNGVVLNETYLNEDTFYGENFEGTTVTLADDEYMLLGDNRNRSLDSRACGLFKEEDLQGTVIFHDTK